MLSDTLRLQGPAHPPAREADAAVFRAFLGLDDEAVPGGQAGGEEAGVDRGLGRAVPARVVEQLGQQLAAVALADEVPPWT
ncbi:MAG: hypothetical protein U5L06_00875 [Rhodovibrio sp.]|nr:hypothetical protein [Rhodovibrio sp.]